MMAKKYCKIKRKQRLVEREHTYGEKGYTIGVMIGNANSPHTMNLMQGIFHAAKSMDVNVLFFLGFTVVITINLILAKIRKMIMIISSM
jgi:hypothetical protein